MKKTSFRIREGHRSVTVFRHAKGWRFGYQGASGWKWVTRKRRADIELAAGKVLAEMEGGFVWSGLRADHRGWLERLAEITGDAETRAAIDGFLGARERSEGIEAAVDRWMASKVAKAGEETPHLSRVRHKIEEVAAAFRGNRCAEIDFPSLLAWLENRTAGLSPTTWGHWRGVLVEFFTWAKREGLVSAAMATAAERIPAKARDRQERRVASRAELWALLETVRPEWRAWVVLSAWCGLRPEEIVPGARKKRHKRGLRCEDIDWDFGVIRVPADVSKVERPRIVPLSAVARAGLRWAGIEPGMTGAVVLRNPAKCPSSAPETQRLGREVFGGEWPQDVLRHSYGSYRNAILRDLGRVAEEMGTSVAMLHAHYHNPRAEAEGIDWFEVPRSSDGMPLFAVSECAKQARKA